MTGLSFVKLRGFVALLYHAPKRDTRESGRNPPGFQGVQRPPPPSAAEEGRPQRLKRAHEKLQSGSGAGGEFTGWVHLPRDYDREEFARIQAAASRIRCV